MDETKTMNNQNPDGTGAKTFSQDDVNRIVGERLAKEKAKGEAAFAEREQQLAQRELLLSAKEKLTENGLPVELVDALNVSSPEALEKALSIVKTVMDKHKAEARPIKISGAKPAESLSSVKNTGNSSLRKAMGLPE
ncbi:DUF4355 domain-containing protein [Dysosmobacter welbionis]|uniref:DUF4355 domain-containing protein n=1 Tax=Dysosmobacter welbionis TaxID=2093857 RepID=UPI002942B6AE|nr:DUF4355 domain-containing protein [Dysosmobacter welbionis]